MKRHERAKSLVYLNQNNLNNEAHVPVQAHCLTKGIIFQVILSLYCKLMLIALSNRP